MPPTVLSVLIAAYQAQQKVRRAIDSALLLPDSEVVVAPDDGSREYETLQADYPPGTVKVLEPSLRAGSGRSRNRAFDACAGAFVTMLDCDDYLGAGALSEALALAQQSPRHIAFFRTVYLHDASGAVCRELPRKPMLDFDTFIHFHGSIHALYPRWLWQPYSDHRISQDVLFDANMLLASGRTAALTSAPHVKTLHATNVTTETDHAEINAEHAFVLENEAHPRIQQLFREKLRMGARYRDARTAGLAHSFHGFVGGQARDHVG